MKKNALHECTPLEISPHDMKERKKETKTKRKRERERERERETRKC